jgi:hypothetical protein
LSTLKLLHTTTYRFNERVSLLPHHGEPAQFVVEKAVRGALNAREDQGRTAGVSIFMPRARDIR